MIDKSPAVERAIEAAQVRAAGAVRLGHLMLSLLDEEEGLAASVVLALGLSLSETRTRLEAIVAESPLVSSFRPLFASARDLSLAYRGDPVFTSDVFLLAVVCANEDFAAVVAQLGIKAEPLEQILTKTSVDYLLPAPPLSRTAAYKPVAPKRVPYDGPKDLSGAARIIDANLNRARESFRVLDDYCRFVLNDRDLTKRLKTARHRLGKLGELLTSHPLLKSRDTLQDVGTSITAAGEFERATSQDVAAVNLKRLQEALRSLEEYGKLLDSEFARGIEQLRYEAYSLELGIVRRSNVRERLADATLYVLLGSTRCPSGLGTTVKRAAAGGADVLQLREKGLNDREWIALAWAMRRWTQEAKVLFIVNDRPDIAHLVNADGVHLGQDDLSVQNARKILGPDALIGASTHNLEQLQQALREGADYVGVGPAFPSRTKTFDHFPGLEFVRAAMAETSLPAFALGGIGLDNISSVVEAGASRVAVGAAVAEANDPERAARLLKEALPHGFRDGQFGR